MFKNRLRWIEEAILRVTFHDPLLELQTRIVESLIAKNKNFRDHDISTKRETLCKIV